jgi:hypothetical protein
MRVNSGGFVCAGVYEWLESFPLFSRFPRDPFGKPRKPLLLILRHGTPTGRQHQTPRRPAAEAQQVTKTETG